METQLAFQLDVGGSIPTSPLHHGKSHQRIIREQKAQELIDQEVPDVDISKAIVKPINYSEAKQLILEYEWLGNMSQRTTHCFGIFFNELIAGAVCYSIPPTPQAAIGVCGDTYASIVKTLSRGACVYWAHPHSASKLISLSLKWMVANTPFRIFVAYSDTRAGEIGTVYQATNWMYTGKTAGDVEYLIDGKWKSGRSARHKSYIRRGIDYRIAPKRKATGKHRYVFIGGNKKEQIIFKDSFRYEILPYPKRESTEKTK